MNPANNPLLSPLEYLKLLYSMLNNIQQKGPGNSYLLEYCEALKEAITKAGPPGHQPLPSLTSTQRSEHAELSTEVIIVDGSPVTVLKDTYVAAPNPNPLYGRTLQSRQDWINVLKELGTEQKWPVVGTVTNPKKILHKISQKTSGHSNQGRTGQGQRLHVNI